MSQAEMNEQWKRWQQPTNPPMATVYPPTGVSIDPVAVLVIGIGRPNCGWLRRLLFEQKALGAITGYEESTGFLWRSFSITGRKSKLQALYNHLSRIMEEK